VIDFGLDRVPLVRRNQQPDLIELRLMLQAKNIPTIAIIINIAESHWLILAALK
jgi:hypothetical protein